jgi:hypothetical protein
MGSTIQPVNQNMMTLYLFHQFLKRYGLVFDATQSHQFEMIFLDVCNKQMKKLDFNQFGTVLAKMSLRMYLDEDALRSVELLDPVDYFLKLVNDYLFMLNLDNDLADDEDGNDQDPP